MLGEGDIEENVSHINRLRIGRLENGMIGIMWIGLTNCELFETVLQTIELMT